MNNVRPVTGSVFGIFKVFFPIMFIFAAIHTLMILAPIISDHVLGAGKDLIFRAVVVALVLSFVMLLLLLKYYKSNSEHRKKIISTFFPKRGANLKQASLRFVWAFALSLVGYLLLLEVSAQIIENMFGDIIEPRQKLSYMASYMIGSPIIAIIYLRLQD